MTRLWLYGQCFKTQENVKNIIISRQTTNKRITKLKIKIRKWKVYNIKIENLVKIFRLLLEKFSEIKKSLWHATPKEFNKNLSIKIQRCENIDVDQINFSMRHTRKLEKKRKLQFCTFVFSITRSYHRVH